MGNGMNDGGDVGLRHDMTMRDAEFGGCDGWKRFHRLTIPTSAWCHKGLGSPSTFLLQRSNGLILPSFFYLVVCWWESQTPRIVKTVRYQASERPSIRR